MTIVTMQCPKLPRKSRNKITSFIYCVLSVWLSAGVLAGAGLASNVPVTRLVPSQQNERPVCISGANPDIRQLAPGMKIGRDIGGGQSHFYEIAVTENQFLRVIVNQQMIDLVVTICAPAKSKVVTVDRPSGSNGPEAISILSDQTGTYILEVKSLAKTAPIARYEVRIAEQRNQEPGDDTRIEAEKAISEGEELRGQGKLETLRAAVEKFELARTLWNSLGEPYEEALALYGLGWSHTEIGAHGMVKFPIPVHRLRWSYESRSEHEKAIDCFNRSLAIMKQLGDSYGQAIVEADLGWPELYLDLKNEALESFNSAYQMFKNADNARGAAKVLYGIGWVNAIKGEDLKALGFFSNSLPLRRASKDKKGEAITLAGISRIQHRLERNEEAVDSANKALKIFDDLRDLHGQASTYSVLGWIYHSLNNHQQSLKFFTEALAKRKEIKDKTGEANCLYGIARVHNQQGDLLEALKWMQEVIGIVEPLRAKGESPDLRTYYFANVQEYYEFYIDLLMRLDRLNRIGNYVEAALEAHERARARELLAILAEAADIFTNTDAALSRPLKMAEIKGLLDDDTLLLEYALGAERSYVWVVSNNTVRGYELPKKAEIEARALKLHNLFTARNQRKPGEKEEQKRTRVEQADTQYAEEAAALSQMILGPIASELGTKRLVIVAEDALQLIPFGTLPEPSSSAKEQGRSLILDHEIVSLPSASVLHTLRRQTSSRTPAPVTLAVLADPVFTADDQRVRQLVKTRKNLEPSKLRGSAQPSAASTAKLPNNQITESTTSLDLHRLLGTRWEGQQISALLPDNERLLALDFKASRSQALSASLGQYRIIHFATHAFINDAAPAESAIVLSQVDEQGQQQDGTLSLHDISQLKLRADLVVLSACRTGLGSNIKGEGMRGITGGFMHAGVPRLVVSLWPVDDKVTAEFMVRFYRLLLTGRGLSAAAALREVQIQMLKDERWQSAYFWAPFVLQGEWK